MVVMPAPQGTPWKLQTEYGNEIRKTSTLDNDSDSGIGSDDDMDTKFNQLVSTRSTAVANAATGMTLQEIITAHASRDAQIAQVNGGSACNSS